MFCANNCAAVKNGQQNIVLVGKCESYAKFKQKLPEGTGFARVANPRKLKDGLTDWEENQEWEKQSRQNVGCMVVDGKIFVNLFKYKKMRKCVPFNCFNLLLAYTASISCNKEVGRDEKLSRNRTICLKLKITQFSYKNIEFR